MTTEYVYRPSLVVRLLCPLLPRAWQEELATAIPEDEFADPGNQLRKKFQISFCVVLALFVGALVFACWAVPVASPFILLAGLAVAWWGYGALGLEMVVSDHRQWVSQMIRPPSDNLYCSPRARYRWEYDLILIFGRPESMSEIEMLWLTDETPKVVADTKTPRRL